MIVQMMNLMILRSVAAFRTTMGILSRQRLRMNRHQTDRAPALMHVLHCRTPIVNRRILGL
jgi:hypothetical protein